MTENGKDIANTGHAGAVSGFLPAALLQKRWLPLFLLLIAAVGFLAYANAFHVPFVFDDQVNITGNAAIRSLHGIIGYWRYPRFVGAFTFFLNYMIGGYDVFSFHVFNLAIHLINAMLVFSLGMLLLKTPFFRGWGSQKSLRFMALPIALFTALLFVAHPVQTEAVTYIVQRYASLSTMFFLLSLAAFIKWRLTLGSSRATRVSRLIPGGRVGQAGLFCLALISAVLAMGTKETAFTLPLIMAAVELSFFRGAAVKRLLLLAPFLLTMAVIPVRLQIAGEPLFNSVGISAAPPRIDYLLTQFRVIVTYLRLLILPAGQNLDYDYPVYRSLADPNVFLSLLLLLAVAAAGVYLYYYSGKHDGARPLRLSAFGIAWFFITLSVESSIISIQDVIFEYRLYLPSIGIFLAAVTLLIWAAGRGGHRSGAEPKAVVLGLALLVAIFTYATFARNRVWGSAFRLWADTVAKSPGKSRPHNNLGVQYQYQANFRMAQKEYELAVSLDPGNPEAHYNLGQLYDDQGRYADARTQFQDAIKINPSYQKARESLAELPEVK